MSHLLASLFGGLGPGPVLVLVGVVLLGSAVQSMVGLGLNLVSAPVVTLVAPSLMPELPLALAVLLPVATLAISHDDVDWPGLAWVLPARVVGTVLGVAFLGWFSTRQLGVAVGVMVLLAVVLTYRAVRVPVTRPSLLVAGFVAGVSGTTTSIGGPPVALLYQHRAPQQIRSTLAVFFSVGALVSLGAIALGGRFHVEALPATLALAPVLAVGAVLGAGLRGIFPERATRLAVLVVCAASALLVLVRTLL